MFIASLLFCFYYTEFKGKCKTNRRKRYSVLQLALRAHGISLRELEYRGIRAGVIWQDGEDFNAPDSIRTNLALPKSLLVEAMSRLKNYAFL